MKQKIKSVVAKEFELTLSKDHTATLLMKAKHKDEFELAKMIFKV
jgi:hypothetical protein